MPDIWGEVTLQSPPPLLALVKNVSLWNPSLDTSYYRGGFTSELTCQGKVEASTYGGGADAYLLEDNIDGRLALAESLQTAARVRLYAITYIDEALR